LKKLSDFRLISLLLKLMEGVESAGDELGKSGFSDPKELAHFKQVVSAYFNYAVSSYLYLISFD
jgi:uncharacterized protein YaaR (DUF327 family)